MSKAIRRLYRRLANLSPETKQVIIGVGLAIDPLPEYHYQTFHRSDVRALRSDWRAVGGDLWYAIGRAKQERDRECKRAAG